MLTSPDKYVEFWGPRIGDDAARMRWRATKLYFWAYASMWVWAPCLVLGIMFQIIVLVIVGIIAVCAEVVLIVWMLVTRHQAKALAGLRLGLKIGIGKVPEPPRSRDGYEAWCRRYGVEPYAANAPKHIAAELTEES